MFKKVYGKIYFGCFFFFNGKLCLGLFKNIEVKTVTATENQSIFIHLLTISINIKSFILFK